MILFPLVFVKQKSTLNGKYLKNKARAEAFKPHRGFLDLLFLPAVISDEGHLMLPCYARHLGYGQRLPQPSQIDFHVAFLLLLQAEAQYGMDWREDQCADESIGSVG